MIIIAHHQGIVKPLNSFTAYETAGQSAPAVHRPFHFVTPVTRARCADAAPLPTMVLDQRGPLGAEAG